MSCSKSASKRMRRPSHPVIGAGMLADVTDQPLAGSAGSRTCRPRGSAEWSSEKRHGTKRLRDRCCHEDVRSPYDHPRGAHRRARDVPGRARLLHGGLPGRPLRRVRRAGAAQLVRAAQPQPQRAGRDPRPALPVGATDGQAHARGASARPSSWPSTSGPARPRSGATNRSSPATRTTCSCGRRPRSRAASATLSDVADVEYLTTGTYNGARRIGRRLERPGHRHRLAHQGAHPLGSRRLRPSRSPNGWPGRRRSTSATKLAAEPA